MKFRITRIIAMSSIALILLLVMLIRPSVAEAGPLAQQPTGSIPTVTSTPRGPYVVVNSLTANDTQINVRAGPSRLSELVGVLLVGQEVNALGVYGEWVLIEYPVGPDGTAWVYGNLVTLYGGDLPQVQPPATATPDVTRTVDPTLAAQFLTTPNATQLPTFTEPAPLEIPTYTTDLGNTAAGGVPMGLIIVGLGALGLFLVVIALISGR
ncbi:MAG: SH3 domain-containing protein [Anaerolineaceae bacterium]|nr:SH3 domain-containing protein [Anaerolineaceae bacterium]